MNRNEYSTFECIMYEEISAQKETDPPICWGNGYNVLLLSDRCPGRARGFYEYLTEKTDLSHVYLCSDLTGAMECVVGNPIHMIVFIGLQKEKGNYSILKSDFVIQGKTHFAMYANVDDAVVCECNQYGIKSLFHCETVMRDIVFAMQSIFQTGVIC